MVAGVRCMRWGNHNIGLLQFVQQKACFYSLGFIRVFVCLFPSAINWSEILQDNASLSEISGSEGGDVFYTGTLCLWASRAKSNKIGENFPSVGGDALAAEVMALFVFHGQSSKVLKSWLR